MELFKYAVRIVTAFMMLGVAAVLALLAVAVDHGRATVFGIAGVLAVAGWFSWPRHPDAWRNDPPTQRQLEYAADLGIKIPKRATKGQVSDLISQVAGR